jgi:hypothetical protein
LLVVSHFLFPFQNLEAAFYRKVGPIATLETKVAIMTTKGTEMDHQML